jgi:hypothetical protein
VDKRFTDLAPEPVVDPLPHSTEDPVSESVHEDHAARSLGFDREAFTGFIDVDEMSGGQQTARSDFDALTASLGFHQIPVDIGGGYNSLRFDFETSVNKNDPMNLEISISEDSMEPSVFLGQNDDFVSSVRPKIPLQPAASIIYDCHAYSDEGIVLSPTDLEDMKWSPAATKDPRFVVVRTPWRVLLHASSLAIIGGASILLSMVVHLMTANPLHRGVNPCVDHVIVESIVCTILFDAVVTCTVTPVVEWAMGELPAYHRFDGQVIDLDVCPSRQGSTECPS